MVRARRRDGGGRAWRLFLFAAYALLFSWSWQLGLVELFEHHDEMTQECPDDDGPCDCGSNCHCCLTCAHQTAPVVVPSPAEGPPTVVAIVELTLCTEHAAPRSILYGPAPKVPKHLS